MKNRTSLHRSQSRGSALLIVLAFLLLLTTLAVAFLSRATLERLLSNASVIQSRVDLTGQTGIATIIADLQQEIVAGSNVGAGTSIPTLATGYYYPNAPATVVPALAVPGYTTSTIVGTGIEDLLKISYRNTNFWPSTNYTAAGPIRAAPVSTTTASLNNRLVSTARWNKPLLMAKASPNQTTDFTPVTAFTNNPPDWIYVARDGSNPTTWDTMYQSSANVAPTTAAAAGTPGTNPVTQRFAYAIYDEGSTLDMNVAGSPMPATLTYSPVQPYKSALAYADLTQLTPIVNSGWSTANKTYLNNAIIGWRNYASAGISNPGTAKFPATASATAYSFTAATAPSVFTPFDLFISQNANGFINAGNTALATGANGTASTASDNAFASRQQLLQFLLQGIGGTGTFSSTTNLAILQNLMPYLGTFSRDLSQPSYAPDPTRPIVQKLTNGGNDLAGQLGFGGSYSWTSAAAKTAQNAINPAFLGITATSTFTRNDSSIAVTGEPLVKKRFALNRLAWLTYQGPIADRSYLTSNANIASLASPGTSSADYDIWALVNVYGIPQSFLAQGTDANVLKYFGLVWVKDNATTIGINDGTYKWKYEHGANVTGSGGASTSATTPGTINTLSQVAALSPGREADFIELLKAAITVGAIAKPGTSSGSVTSPGGYQNAKDSSVDAYIIQLAANIINQSNIANYSTRILFDDGTWKLAGVAVPQEYRGIADLPYLYRVRGSYLKLTDSTPIQQNSDLNAATTETGYTATGTGEFFQLPEIWVPHTWNPGATVTLRPTSFQLLPLSADPVNINAGNKTSLGTTQILAHSRNNPFASNWNDAPGDPGELVPFFINGEKITFTIPATATGVSFFREPTILNKPDPTGGAATDAGPPKLSAVAASGNALQSDGTTSAQSNAQVTSWYKGACYASGNGVVTSIAGITDNQKYLGFNFGTVPLWIPNPNVSTVTSSTPVVMTTSCAYSGNSNFTYQLQYLDPNPNDPAGTYITYDEKFLPLALVPPNGGGRGMNGGINAFLTGTQNTTVFGNGAWSGGDKWNFDTITFDNYEVVADPRTARFSTSMFTNEQTGSEFIAPPGSYNGGVNLISQWVDASQNALMTARPDYCVGWAVATPPPALGFYNQPSPNGWQCMAMGTLAQNSMNGTWTANGGLSKVDGQSTMNGSSNPEYYADADGVVRRASAGYSGAPAFTGLLAAETTAQTAIPPTAYNGLPLQTATTFTSGAAAPSTYSSRPIMLNRPFRTVAELAYTFSGTPWKNIDFSTPESGYAALLDVFCINDTNDPNGLVAGKVNLNTRQSAVINAVLAGAYKNEFNPTTTGISAADAALISTSSAGSTYGLITRTTSTTSPYGPLRNVSELVGNWVPSASTTAPVNGALNTEYSGFSGDLSSILTTDVNSSPYNFMVQRFREAGIRALASSGTTRVWNLMIDVIAQTGRFPSSATGLANFNVEGERRYWVHVAIDRYTGKVLDEQIEEVKE